MQLDWFTYALIAGMANSVLGILQKMVLKNKEADPAAFSICFQLFVGIIVLFILRFDMGPLPTSINVWLMVLLDSLVYVIATLMYFHSVKTTEISQVRIISSIRPAWILFGGFIFFKESITPSKAGGIFLIIFGLMVVYWNRQGFKSFGRPQLILVVYSIISAVGGIMDKYLISYFSPTVFIVISFIPVPVLTAAFVPKAIPKMRHLLRCNKCGLLTLVCSLVMVFASFCLYSAFKYSGEISRVHPIWQASTVLTVVLGVIFLKERENMINKLVGAAIIFAGVVFIR